MKTHKIILAICIMASIAQAQDLRQPDSLIIGNLDRTPVVTGLGAQIVVPVWIKMDDTVAYMIMPVASNNEFIASRDSGLFYAPFSQWPEINFYPPDTANPVSGFTNQCLTAFNPLWNPPIPPGEFMNQWVHVADFLMTTTTDSAALGSLTYLSEGHSFYDGVRFQTLHGQVVFTPAIVWGGILIGQVNDILIVGNLDRSPMVVSPGQQVTVPVWFWSNPVNIDSLTFAHIPVASDNAFVISRNGGNLGWPLSEWDDASFLFPNADCNEAGFTNQGILGFACLTDTCNDNVWLYTDGEYWHIADFNLTIRSDTLLIGDTTRLIEGCDPANAGMMFTCSNDMSAHIPHAFFNLLQIERLSGDANFSGAVNGIDVTYMVAYLKGFGPAPVPYLAGDANGDCNVNGIDVVYLVVYLRGIGAPPIRADCAQ
ncbi:MAG: hypothetical protein A2W25_00455 [candidate division Zixibacteria bacterium RBG_16_53_22]|nr:MAG: hypothetical protein A2W25_00455 [candidate division Zixibacteria bacterium RBG_16_53_22]